MRSSLRTSLRTPLRQGVRGTLTQAQTELQPYVEEEKKKQDLKSKILPALGQVFDLLQRGQYAGVNFVDEIIKSFMDEDSANQDVKDVFKAVWQGITGERKGYFEDTLKDTFSHKKMIYH